VAPLPEEMVSMFLAVSVPDPPADPTPGQVVAYAELVTLVGDRSLTRKLVTRARAVREVVSDEAALLTGLGEALELAGPLLGAGRRPGPGPALDRFVAAHAQVRGGRDTAAFRRELRTALRREPLVPVAVDGDPRMRRYWGLVGEVTGEPVTVTAVHDWLLASLECSAADGS
jgi:hypothetical protein